MSVFSVVLAGGLAALSDSPTVLVLAVAVGLAVGALALVRHARPEGRSALQWTLGGIVVAGLAIGYAARHPIIALLGAGSDFSMRVNLWNTMVDYLRIQAGAGLGMVRTRGTRASSRSARSTTRCARATRPG